MLTLSDIIVKCIICVSWYGNNLIILTYTLLITKLTGLTGL